MTKMITFCKVKTGFYLFLLEVLCQIFNATNIIGYLDSNHLFSAL